MKKLILLDLDNTIFDTLRFRKRLFQKIGKMLGKGTEVERISLLCQEMYEEHVREFGLFDPDVFLDRLLSKIRKKGQKDKLMTIIFDSRNLKTYFHSEVARALSKLLELGEIGIFSQGDERLQHAKLAALPHSFHPEKVHITTDKKSTMPFVFNRYKEYKTFFVDDMLSMLYTAKKVNPSVTTIWMRRGRYAKREKELDDFSPDATARRLDEVVKIVEEK